MQDSLLRATGRQLAGWFLGLLLLLGLPPQLAHATHIRAGDIQSKVDTVTGNPNHLYFKLTLYCDPANQNTLQTDASIFFGDGTRQDKIPRKDNITVNDRVHIYTFYFDHTFPGSGSYRVSFVGENRVDNVVNLPGAVGQTFYICSTITIDPTLGRNHSPVLRAPAVDNAGLGQVFLHNPAAYDADGDSLSYRVLHSLQVPGGYDAAVRNGNKPDSTVCSNYVYPNSQLVTPGATRVTYPGIPTAIAGTQATYTQDKYTGQIMWNAPAKVGYYNVAMVVEEWRRSPGGYRRLIGQVIRDIQILVSSTSNLPPQLTVPADICVQAGQTATLNVTAIDGQSTGTTPTPVTLFAYSGTIPPATFTQTRTGTSVAGTYTWQTDCSNVAKEPYLVVFKAQDNPGTGNPVLIDERPVRITVVGPPPQNLTAQAGPGNSALLQWTRYTCTNASQLLIFRREGCYAYTPGPCDTGLPAGAGYVQVGAVPATTTTFADSPLERGKTYSYRIYAVFPLPAGGSSLVSNEACLTIGGRSALLTNVDVNATSITTGQITVKWTQPRTNSGTTTFTAPYGYRLSRALASAPTAFTLVREVQNSIADTTFVDTGLNTEANQYIYQLVFYRSDTSNGTLVESADSPSQASSVRTSLVANGNANTISVNFAYQVPWDNSQQPARIFRRTGTTGAYAPIATVTPGAATGSYVDADPSLQRNQTYCYYVQTVGQYATPVNSAGASIYTNLLNKSQEVCATLRPTPCTPVLSLRVINCDSLAALPQYPAPNQSYQNSLSWTVGSTPAGCQANAAYYRVFRATSAGGPFALLDSTTQLRYLNRLLPQQTYCYQVQAVTATGERSALSNVACQSECVFFLLPNIFTPNGDALNATFRPKTSSPVRRTHVQIFNRWGRKVYESDQNPYIEWQGDGTNGESTGSGPLADGIYYYLAEVQFADSGNTQRVYKGWVELIR
ncbi:gliding motility-associated C-terminal domain-containing protein [Hymenobacter sp. RP-2-7]|uniref:Gliding motility-associated C-terminal domain-containing protein n=1 Tax=Hymenobacter polaris TaxID=2682546 RepID=A0A7Y0AH29_9BACT|nr:gliding motility-associated C-terminal domain-containing protein [Hymenobacter polaris]NML67241.1 gliding motility-associated C-terminal domain-containing protein [Hymenobacter polaris]